MTVPVKDDSAAAFAAFSDDSDVVTITADDGSGYTWDTRIESTIATACTMAGRNLTRDEWTEAFGERPYEKTCP
ncbi:hypothetical protein [Kribbella sp. NPDC048915]|uniref:hypothetical protein n=1 Tax=Kribbella sp. NPDC048915 TaxID=3155148 RepID=UPI0033CFCCDC